MKQRITFQSAKAEQKKDDIRIRYSNFILSAVAITHTGSVRKSNEDNYAMVLDHDPLTDKHHALFVVADGMGGHECGEEASNVVCETHMQAPQQDLVQLAQESCTNVQKIKYAYEAPGSTEVALRITEDQEHHFHVGDSRLYRFNRTHQTLDQLTEDDSVAWRHYREGRLGSEEEARQVHYKNIVTASIGNAGFDDDRTSSPLQKVSVGDVYLLCSDGLWDDLPKAQIKDTLQTSYRTAPNDHRAAAKALVQAALNAGGSDNITVLLVGIDPLIKDKNEEGLYTQGKALFAQKNYEGARACLEAVLLRNPKNSWAHYMLGMVYVASPILDPAAIEYHFRSALRIRPAFATKDTEEALTFIAQKDYTRALWAVERAAHITPYLPLQDRKKLAGTANKVGIAFKDGATGKKDYVAARRAFNAALSSDIHNTDARYHLGTIALMQKDYVLAEATLRDVIQREPTHRWAHYQIARVHEMTGNSEARNHYQTAADLGLEQAATALQKLKGR